MRLTLEEKTFIVENHKIFKSYTLLRRKFCTHFNKRNAPNEKTVKNIINKFKKLGTVENLPSTGRKKTATTDDKINEVCDLMKNKLGMSVRRAALASNISIGSVHKIAKSIINLFPYKIKILHELKPPDYNKRKKFSEWFLSINGIEKNFIASDEAYFHLNGAVNNHNCRIWSDSDPNYAIQQPLKPPKVLVWCAVSANRVYGPFFFDSTVNNENYLDMLKNYFWPKVYRTKNAKSLYFQQDGAPAHRHENVQEWLNSKFGSRFLNKDMWPPRSPDLNPCDFFLWGYLKDKIYVQMPQTIDELKRLINEEIQSINSITLNRVFENMTKRCKSILEKDGQHIE